jgi:hypothetical protein
LNVHSEYVIINKIIQPRAEAGGVLVVIFAGVVGCVSWEEAEGGQRGED